MRRSIIQSGEQRRTDRKIGRDDMRGASGFAGVQAAQKSTSGSNGHGNCKTSGNSQNTLLFDENLRILI